jgi:hypothetical protein
MANHTYKRRHVKKSRGRQSRKMWGGSTREELQALGFTPEQIDYLIGYSIKKSGMDLMPTINAFLAQGMSPSKIVEEMQEGEDTTIESQSSFDSNAMGKKSKKSKKTKKNKKSKKSKKSRTRKQKGGICYGSGVGANDYDPNFSIYNTRELQLFPYKPN